MRIKLKPIQISKRPIKQQAGITQDVTRVIVIAMLDDDSLYKASHVAATAWDPTSTHKARYVVEKKALYNWANDNGKFISKTPDNIDPETRKKIRGQHAMWFGKTWKMHVGDQVWNEVADIFDRVYALHTEDIKSGINATYWWNEDASQIERDVVTPEKATPAITISQRPATSRSIYSRLIVAAVLIVGMFGVIYQRKSERTQHQVLTISQNSSFQQAIISTTTFPQFGEVTKLDGWEPIEQKWALDQTKRPIQNASKRPKLPISAPYMVSYIPGS